MQRIGFAMSEQPTPAAPTAPAASNGAGGSNGAQQTADEGTVEGEFREV